VAIAALGVTLRQDEFANQTMVTGIPKDGAELTNADANRLWFMIQEKFFFSPPKELFEQVLIDVAHINRFHPVRDYIDSRKWGGVPRIDNWLTVYGGAEDTPFNRAIGRIFLIAACRRVRQPGCKFDTMLVLESPIQGKNKSQALRSLATREEWFSDSLPLGAETKEVIEQTSGVWIAKCAELNGLKTREEEKIMAFLSEVYFKKDERRLWPVRIKQFDLDALKRDVDQLWAEAAHYEAQGESIVLQDLWPAAAAARAEREVENPYYASLCEKFGRQSMVRSVSVWQHLEIPRDRQRREQTQVGLALKKLGFTPAEATAKKMASGSCVTSVITRRRNKDG
jgi:predicted P-loop ATPase